MNPTNVYYGIFFTLTGLGMLAVPVVDYINPGFYNYDMCGKSYMDSQGHPNIYDRTNSQELINACYSAKTVLLNPIIQSLTVFGFAYLIIRFMCLGSKAEFVKNNPNPKWRWDSTESNNSMVEPSSYECGTCRYSGYHDDELQNHLRLTGHKRQIKNEVSKT